MCVTTFAMWYIGRYIHSFIISLSYMCIFITEILYILYRNARFVAIIILNHSIVVICVHMWLSY